MGFLPALLLLGALTGSTGTTTLCPVCSVPEQCKWLSCPRDRDSCLLIHTQQEKGTLIKNGTCVASQDCPPHSYSLTVGPQSRLIFSCCKNNCKEAALPEAETEAQPNGNQCHYCHSSLEASCDSPSVLNCSGRETSCVGLQGSSHGGSSQILMGCGTPEICEQQAMAALKTAGFQLTSKVECHPTVPSIHPASRKIETNLAADVTDTKAKDNSLKGKNVATPRTQYTTKAHGITGTHRTTGTHSTTKAHGTTGTPRTKGINNTTKAHATTGIHRTTGTHSTKQINNPTKTHGTTGTHSTKGSNNTTKAHGTTGTPRTKGSNNTTKAHGTTGTPRTKGSNNTTKAHATTGTPRTKGSNNTTKAHGTTGTPRTKGSNNTTKAHATTGTPRTKGINNTTKAHATTGTHRTTGTHSTKGMNSTSKAHSTTKSPTTSQSNTVLKNTMCFNCSDSNNCQTLPCPLDKNYRCLQVAGVASMYGSTFVSSFRKGFCVAAEDCRFSNEITSFTFNNGSGFWANATCCQGHCPAPPPLKKLPVSDLQSKFLCPVCGGDTPGSCKSSLYMQCPIKETSCVQLDIGEGGQNISIKGCGTSNLCSIFKIPDSQFSTSWLSLQGVHCDDKSRAVLGNSGHIGATPGLHLALSMLLVALGTALS